MNETREPDAASIRVLIADDQELVRRGMALILSVDPGIDVVAQACDGTEAVDMAVRSRPDVVLMDLHMPRMSGIAATRQIVSQLPSSHVLVLTTLDAEEAVFDAIRAGARGYLLKDASEQELLDSIRLVYRGESMLTPQIARMVMDQFRRLSTAPESPLHDPAPPATIDRTEPVLPASTRPTGVRVALSGKEERILRLIVEGRSNRQIAKDVFLAEGTVKNYVSRIMEKLHANTRTELAVISVRGRQRG